MKHFFVSLLWGLIGISTITAQNSFATKKRPVDYVNPFIGTGGHGHTYPGATYPFGMVQLSPDTRLTGWDGCSGYHYSDSVIYGFSHTHLSGTGVSDYADVLLMPVACDADHFFPESIAAYPFSRSFSKKDEKASAGYYSVKTGNVLSELTASPRCGIHRYSYTSSTKAQVNGLYLDLAHRDVVKESYLKLISPTEIGGFRKSSAWANDQFLYFYIRFSAPYSGKIYLDDHILKQQSDSINGKNIKAMLRFEVAQLEVQVSISSVSIANAKLNLETELNTKTFDQVNREAVEAWNSELSKISASDNNQDKLSIFYTALYHCMVVPNLYSDVNGQYLGRDFKVHNLNGNHEYYTVFSLWDTYRAYHPLMTLIDRKRTSDFVNTFLMQYQQGGELPVWEFASNETYCMIGYHSAPVITDAMLKDIQGFDYTLALKAMKHSSNLDHFGLKSYREYGYIPMNYEAESVSRTLEYAYDDYCIAKAAEKIGDKSTATDYFKRAQYYKNVFEPTGGFFRPKSNGGWLSPFDPREVTFHFTEANAWQYAFYVPQDVGTHINLLGGDEKYIRKLDFMFSQPSQTTGREQVDITGLIGQYAHGNEPSHHMAYLYNYAGAQWKTAEIVDSVLKSQYHNSPDGLSGNEDCGQMSAWYVLSSMGFYPVNPADSIFAIGRPWFNEVVIRLENGKSFTLKCTNQSPKNKYVRSATLNGVMYEQSYISYQTIMRGGTMVIEMSDKPVITFGQTKKNRPFSAINDENFLIVPVIVQDELTFSDSLEISMQNYNSVFGKQGSEIRFSLDNGKNWRKYTIPFHIYNSTEILAKCISGNNESHLVSAFYRRIPAGRTIKINSKYSPQYTAGGDQGIIDFLRGGTDFRTGGWQGYQAVDFEAVVDLGKIQKISKLALGCLQDSRAWIMMPKFVEFQTSVDGINFVTAGKVENTVPDVDQELQTKDFELKIKPVEARYVRVYARNYGKLPSWHLGAGGEAYIFIDEIVVE